MISAHYPALLIIIPLLSAFLATIAGFFTRKSVYAVSVTGLALLLLTAFRTAWVVITTGTIRYNMSGWAPPYGIELVIDNLSALMISLVAFVAFTTAVHSKDAILKDFPEKIPAFFVLYLLLTGALMGLCTTGDAFNLYVMLEISSLTTYGLIAAGGGRAYHSTFNYIMIGTLGATFYLLGVGYLYLKTGTLNMADIHSILPLLGDSSAILVAFILMMSGVFIKMALFPMHGWLPNAYTYAPSETSAIVAPLSTKVSVYIMLRLLFSVFSPEYAFERLDWSSIIVWLGTAAIVFGASMALMQRDLKRMLTYIIIAEVGYMVGGAWLGNRAGMTGTIFHIANDCLVTLCLFLVVSNIQYRRGSLSFQSLKGMFRSMPYTMVAFVVGAFAIIGVPPTGGFFSKWYLISGGLQSGHWQYVVALLFASLVNVVLFFRIFEIAHFERQTEEDPGYSEGDVPVGMIAPVWCVALLLILLGLGSHIIVNSVISPAIPLSV